MLLNTDNKIYILKFEDNGSNNRKTASNFAEKIVRIAACTVLNTKNNDLHFLKDAHGKPFLQNCTDFHFNISHSKNAVVVALGSSSVGVDIEVLREVNLKVADRFFSETEKEYVKDNETFLYIWTRKEAFVKQTGEGLSRHLPSFNSLDNRNIKTFRSEGYFVSVCSENVDAFEIEILTESDILKAINILEN